MSGPAQNNGRAKTPDENAGVLANLPRTRPQRATARRAAARTRDGSEHVAAGEPSRSSNGDAGSAGDRTGGAQRARKQPRAAGTKAKSRAGAKATSRAAAEPSAKPAKRAAAKQSRATAKQPRSVATPPKRKAPAKRPKALVDDVPRQGFETDDDRATGAVQPPGGTELVGAAAEIVTEIAKAGIAGGERVLRDVLSRFGRS